MPSAKQLTISVKTLVDSGLGEPNSLTVDFYNYDVCWADAGSKQDGIGPRIGK